MIPETSDRATSQGPAPRVSIVVATFNAGRTLQHCIDSICGQSSPDWELLVADGGSRDDTVAIIRANEGRIRWWKSAPDGGIYDAWNQALQQARGEYVLFLGADDWLHSPDTLSRVFALMAGNPFDLVTGRGVLVDENDVDYHQFGSAWDYRKLRRRITICHPGALHRRELFDRFGLFDTRYRICADYDFLLRLPESTRSLFFDAPIARIRDAGVSRRKRWLMLRESYRAQAHCKRVGPVFAALNYLDRLWRIPVAKLLGMPH